MSGRWISIIFILRLRAHFGRYDIGGHTHSMCAPAPRRNYFEAGLMPERRRETALPTRAIK
eukprot:14647901-Heterocapsa_arctica.AAC.1